MTDSAEPYALAAGQEVQPLRSVVHRFSERVRELGTRVAIHQRNGEGWEAITWTDWNARAERFAAALIAVGVSVGERVAIVANTRVEWAIADLGILMAGAITTPVYASSTADQLAFILGDCNARLVLCETHAQLDIVRRASQQLPALVLAVCIEPLPPPEPARDAAGSRHGDRLRQVSWAEFDDEGRRALAGARAAIEARSEALRPETVATLVYTSGTSGVPKGVRISHASLLYASSIGIGPLGITSDDVQLMFLPLAHIIAKAMLVSSLHTGCSTAMDPNPVNVLRNCRELGVTFFSAVPRVLERLAARSSELSTVIAGAGLGGRVRFVVTGGAALSTDWHRSFAAAGLPIYEGYGLTESGGGLALNLPGACRPGSVGRPPPGTRLRVAPDGEILASGPGIMLGYHARPDEEQIALRWQDGERWLCTGDIGAVDADGFLWITDRKKDLFKTSSGKFIAPLQLENLLEAASPLVSQAVVCGENRGYVVALVTLDGPASSALEAELALDPAAGALHQQPALRARLLQALETVNAKLAPFERIRDIAVVPEFSVESGDLTPTIKLRRRAILRKHEALVNSMYSE